MSAEADAIDLEKLVMPGPVVKGHAEIEADCAKCHAPFRKASQDALCLDCHTKVNEDLTHASGFHGRAPGLAKAACRDCHTEHKGRDADVIGLDRAAFDHRFTDYPLPGAHLRLACETLPPGEAALRDAPSACVACHREDDAHRGQLGEDCGRCHEESAWAKAKFDHDKTDFPLTGEHRNVACALCHPGEHYENTAQDCNGCHRLNDAHLGRFGTGCADCHTAQGLEAGALRSRARREAGPEGRATPGWPARPATRRAWHPSSRPIVFRAIARMTCTAAAAATAVTVVTAKPPGRPKGSIMTA